MEYWDIYDEKKQRTGRTMKRNDWSMKPDEFHLTVLGVLKRPDGRYLITQRKLDKEWGAGWWEVCIFLQTGQSGGKKQLFCGYLQIYSGLCG